MMSDEMGLSQRELLMELRSDIKELKVAVDCIGKEQLGASGERRSLVRITESQAVRLDNHDRDLDDLRRWRDRADGAMLLARWALGASLVSLAAVLIQFISEFGHTP